MNSSSMELEHSSTLDPGGLNRLQVGPPMKATSNTGESYRGPVKILMLAPFQYKYGGKSYWVTTGEWYSLDPIKDREEIIYLDSPSNPYRQFMYMEGHGGIATQEEKGEVYESGTDYRELASNPPPVLRSNALLPPPDPAENPHILETLAKAGLSQTPSLVSLTANPPLEPLGSNLEEVIPSIPSEESDLPRYGEPIPETGVIEAVVVEGLGTSPDRREGIEEVPVPTAREMREAELRSMKAGPLKSLATSMGLEYKDKETTIKQILDLE